MVEHMKESLSLLAEFKGHSIDERLIAHLAKHHCTTLNECTEES